MTLYYSDESSIEINKKTWRVLIPKSWWKYQIKWFENLHNQRHIFGFLRDDWRILYTIRKKKKSEDFIKSLCRLREREKSEYIVLIVDNASIHKSIKVWKYCKEKNIIPVYLPPYCPDLNPIEKFWKKVKRKFMLIQWEIWKTIEEKIRKVIIQLWNQKSLVCKYSFL